MGMIKSERELKISKDKVQKMEDWFLQQEESNDFLKKQAIFSTRSFQLQIQDEINEYENIKKGKIPKEYFQLKNIGYLLISLRIKNGLTQAELAQKLAVAPSQVSRDENNEYHGASILTILKVLKALDEEVYLKLL